MKSNAVSVDEVQAVETPRIRFRCDPFVNLFHQLFPGEMKVFEFLGIHPTHSKPMANPFSVKHLPEDFRNVGEHSIAVAIAARAIAKALVQSRAVPPVYIRRVMQRALFHDAFKPAEVMFAKVYGQECDNSVCRERVLHSLARERIPSYLIGELLTAGRETGHLSLLEFFTDLTQSRDLVDRRLGDKLVFLADMLTSTSLPPNSETYFTSSSDRLARCAVRYPFLANGGLVRNDEGKIEHTFDVSNLPSAWKNLGSYVELQEAVTGGIAKEICSALIPGGVSTVEEAESFILFLIRDSLQNLSAAF